MKKFISGLGRKLAAFAATITLFGLSALAPAHAGPVSYNDANYGPRAAQLCDFPAQCQIDNVKFGAAGQSFKLEEIILGQGFSATMRLTDGMGGPGFWSFFTDLGILASHLQALPTDTSLVGTVLEIMEPRSLFMQTDAKHFLFNASTPFLTGVVSLQAWVVGHHVDKGSTGALNLGTFISGDSQPVALVSSPGTLALAGLALVAVVLSQRRKSPA